MPAASVNTHQHILLKNNKNVKCEGDSEGDESEMARSVRKNASK